MRVSGSYAGPERRQGERRVLPDRRIEDPGAFSREDLERIKEFVTKSFLPGKKSGRLGVSCPQCGSDLVMKTPVRWAGGVTVLEVVCRGCPRRAYWKS